MASFVTLLSRCLKNPCPSWLPTVIVAVIGAICSRAALAIDIYQIYTDNACRHVDGAVIRVDEKLVHILTLKGNIRQIPIGTITQMALYQARENPFPYIPSGTGDAGMLEVLAESEHEAFSGYPIAFYENLVVFLDKEGRSKVLENQDIISIKITGETPNQKLTSPLIHKTVILRPPPTKESCANVSATGSGDDVLIANQVFQGRLKLDTFFERMYRGYQELDSLRERIHFYYKPIVFDQKNRLGALYTSSNWEDVYKMAKPSWDRDLPLYFETGGGKSYRFQSHFAAGTHSWESLPSVRPMAAVQSKFKSHMLHGILVGNFSGITAGKAIFNTSWTNSLSDRRQRSTLWLTSSFNHETLLGFDYQHFSMSYGYYFPVFALGRDREYREIVSSNSSPVWRLAWQEPRWQAEAYFYHTAIRGESGLSGQQGVSADQTENSKGPLLFYSEEAVPGKFKLKAFYARLNLHRQWTTSVVSGIGLVMGKVDYKESAVTREQISQAGENVASTATSSDVSQSLLAASAYLRWDFGRWVAIRVDAIGEHSVTKGHLTSATQTVAGSQTDMVTHYMAGLEFIL